MQNPCLKTSPWWSRASHLLEMDISVTKVSKYGKSKYTRALNASYVSTSYEFLLLFINFSNTSPKEGRTEMILYTVITKLFLFVSFKYWSKQRNLKVTLNNTRKEDWLNINMYVSGWTIYFNSVHISLLPKFFLWETNRKKACHKCLIKSSRGSITAVKTVYCAFLCAMELDVNKELISTRQNHRFLSNNYTSQQMTEMNF